MPIIYIGQADGVRNRIDSHFQNKDFWDWSITFLLAIAHYKGCYHSLTGTRGVLGKLTLVRAGVTFVDGVRQDPSTNPITGSIDNQPKEAA